EDDPDFMIYSGFFGDDDRSHMETLRGIAPADLGRVDFPFKDRRLPEMQFRYRARNFPETLKGEEDARWREFCRSRLEEPAAVERFEQSLEKVRESDQPESDRIVADLTDYVAGIRAAVA
ncbi:MAG: exodeoxyribonuclease I, partial [Gammaproteobacteria bacterium]|nr:exodeoxyribonuclease I [Gammaproteobacteria bacterium]